MTGPQPKITLRLSHPDYASDREWGELQRQQGITLESLRDQAATIVMKTKDADQQTRMRREVGELRLILQSALNRLESLEQEIKD